MLQELSWNIFVEAATDRAYQNRAVVFWAGKLKCVHHSFFERSVKCEKRECGLKGFGRIASTRAVLDVGRMQENRFIEFFIGL